MEHKIRRPKQYVLELTIIKVVGERLAVETKKTSGEAMVVLVVRLSHNKNKNYEERKDARCIIVLVKYKLLATGSTLEQRGDQIQH